MRPRQIIPPEYCKNCDVCCRFLDIETPLAPALGDSSLCGRDSRSENCPLIIAPSLGDSSLCGHNLLFENCPLIDYGDRYICKNFDPAENNCKDYKNRPLDCQIYPFVVMWDEEYGGVVLGVDKKCPYVEKIPNSKIQISNKFQITNPKFQEYKDYLISALKDMDPKYIARFQDDVIILGKMESVAPKEPVLNKFLIGDKQLFEKYASRSDRPFSTYSFIANYVWTGLLDYYWAVIDSNLCLFCKTKETIFMPIPPLGKAISKNAVKESFSLMDKMNKNKSCSRIEDISAEAAEFFKALGYKIKDKGQEYIYRQKDLANLSGDKYKDKRALCNYFEKNYKFEYRNFMQKDTEACITLFKFWQREKVQRLETSDQKSYYKALIEDSFLAHKKAMLRYNELGFWGRVVVVDDKISAYTFGYPLTDDTFVVLFEIADLNTKGLSQFIFREFSKELGNFEFINAMDDSGLENLKRVKLSYHPVKIERTLCVYHE